VSLGKRRTAGRDFQHVHAFDALEPVEIEVGATRAASLPVAEGHIARVPHTDTAHDRDAFLFDEALVWTVGALVDEVAGRFIASGLDPRAELVVRV